MMKLRPPSHHDDFDCALISEVAWADISLTRSR